VRCFFLAGVRWLLNSTVCQGTLIRF